MLTANCKALSFLKGHHVGLLLGAVIADNEESVSPLPPLPAGGSEEDDGDDVLPASKKAASDTCPDCGTFFLRPGHIPIHRGKAACIKAQKRKQVRGLLLPRLSLSHPLRTAANVFASRRGGTGTHRNVQDHPQCTR